MRDRRARLSPRLDAVDEVLDFGPEGFVEHEPLLLRLHRLKLRMADERRPCRSFSRRCVDRHLLARACLISESSGDSGTALGPEELRVDEVALFDVREPGDVKHDCRAVIELDERGGEVFNVHIGTGTVPHEVVELVVHRATDAHRPRIAHQPQRQVQHVNAKVDQRTAA